MTRVYKLVHHRGEWAVCSKARRIDENGREYRAWIYGKERIELCRVEESQSVQALPGDGATDFFGNQFPFTVWRKHKVDDHWERAGGSVNVIVANAIFDAFIGLMGSDHMLQLKHGGRIIREGCGAAQIS